MKCVELPVGLKNVVFWDVNIPKDGVLHKNLKSNTALTGWALKRRPNVFLVRYELGFHISEDGILHSHRRQNLKSYIALTGWAL
jgi:hypothetical protein